MVCRKKEIKRRLWLWVEWKRGDGRGGWSGKRAFVIMLRGYDGETFFLSHWGCSRQWQIIDKSTGKKQSKVAKLSEWLGTRDTDRRARDSKMADE